MAPPLINKAYKIFADYFQFYLLDSEARPFDDLQFTDEDLLRRLKQEKGIVIIPPERNMTVPVDLDIEESDPEIPFDEWQHVAEAGLALPSGKLRIEECTRGIVDEITLAPNTYKIRLFCRGLDTLSFDGLDGDDYYKIVMWPGPLEETRVLKQFPRT